ncbi:hypothetical protein AB0F30_17160 [Streptomyces sp. NPDC029006]|uniref:hypothetical protein n=1 Tax=Streptomyces sp. NPDC029006 TaxID=3155467 RepID=UPI0033D7DDDD
MEVIAAMAVRSTATAAAVFTAAVVVYALVEARRVRRLRRVLVRERATHHLTTGCLVRDLDRFQRRLHQAVVQDAVAAAAGRVLDEALSTHNPKIPPMEGGPR